MSNIVKANFIQFSTENTRVIDTNSLVAKRLEGFSGVLRENTDEAKENEFEEQGLDSDVMNRLLSDGEEASFGEDGEFAPIDLTSLPQVETSESIEEMKRAAIEEIEALKAASLAEIEEMKENARLEGYDIGYNEGKSRADEEYGRKLAELNQEKERLYEEYESLSKNLEPRIVETITGIYKKLFADGFYCKEDVMCALVSQALRNVKRNDEVLIHISEKDAELFEAMKDRLFANLGLNEEPQFRVQENLLEGQAKVETPYGIMDCSIDTELNELTRMLHILAYEVNE